VRRPVRNAKDVCVKEAKLAKAAAEADAKAQMKIVDRARGRWPRRSPRHAGGRRRGQARVRPMRWRRSAARRLPAARRTLHGRGQGALRQVLGRLAARARVADWPRARASTTMMNAPASISARAARSIPTNDNARLHAAVRRNRLRRERAGRSAPAHRAAHGVRVAGSPGGGRAPSARPGAPARGRAIRAARSCRRPYRGEVPLQFAQLAANGGGSPRPRRAGASRPGRRNPGR
jgi:hypothetical protein